VEPPLRQRQYTYQSLLHNKSQRLTYLIQDVVPTPIHNSQAEASVHCKLSKKSATEHSKRQDTCHPSDPILGHHVNAWLSYEILKCKHRRLTVGRQGNLTSDVDKMVGKGQLLGALRADSMPGQDY
jgi:hypothetical protein